MIDLPNDIHDLIEAANDEFEKQCNTVEDAYNHIAHKQPEYFSWITFDVCYVAIATDFSTGLNYENNDDFRNELHKYIDAYFSDEILTHFRNGLLTDITVHIGPQKAQENINEEMGLDPFPAVSKKRKEI